MSFIVEAKRIVPSVTQIDDSSSLDKPNQSEALLQLRRTVKQLTQAVRELQAKVTNSLNVSSDGLPKHGEPCVALSGQFLRLTQPSASPSLVAVRHGLTRRPQGAIFIQSSSLNKLHIAGTGLINPATNLEVTFELRGAVGEEHICILF